MPKKFLKTAAITVFLAMALYALILVPAYEIIACDIMLMDTLLFDAVDLVMQWVEIFALVLICAFLAVGVHRAGHAKACRTLYVLLGGALVFKYVGAILALSVVHGAFDTTLSYGSYAVSLLLELIPAALTVYLTHRYTTATRRENAAKEKAAATLGVPFTPAASPIPFARLFDRTNPLQKAAYIVLGVLTGIRFLAFVASEIAFSMMGFAYQLSDLPVTLIYCLLLVLLPAFIGYILYFYTVRLADKHYR
ncbi:MAG: hypothetical protein IJW51_06850 [Clostridia bacterium]|nr:hypothetical protein [Clostridia bacterium]